MKKIASLTLVFSVVFMSFATTFAQSMSLNTYTFGNTAELTSFDAFPFGTELSENELAQVEGEGRGSAIWNGVKWVARVAAESVVGDLAVKGTQTAGKQPLQALDRSLMSLSQHCLVLLILRVVQ